MFSYLEELLYELSCLEFAQSENVLPFSADHIRHLANREVARLHAQLSQHSPTDVKSQVNFVPSPGVLGLTVFPEQFSASYDVNNAVGFKGDINRVPWRRAPKKNRFSSMVSPLENSFGTQTYDVCNLFAVFIISFLFREWSLL